MTELHISIRLDESTDLEELDNTIRKICQNGDEVGSGYGFGYRDYEFEFKHLEHAEQIRETLKDLFTKKLKVKIYTDEV